MISKVVTPQEAKSLIESILPTGYKVIGQTGFDMQPNGWSIFDEKGNLIGEISNDLGGGRIYVRYEDIAMYPWILALDTVMQNAVKKEVELKLGK
jgi:hypothetical protein